ncbi:MAG: 3-hydroxylacyl-ACP dehydratase [Deltaproteobacteria bacterium]|nr:3-hydroxylacyl-ACP dehydratase [Deltaproteobacteria bacterium]
MTLPDIRSLIPHTGSMVLLDRVIAADAESLCAEVCIRSDSLFCGARGVGAWVGLEYMAQAIAAYAGYAGRLRGEPVKLGFLLGARRYECNQPLFPLGSVLQVHVRRVFQNENGLGSFECRIDDLKTLLATATVTVFQPADVEDFLQGSSK